MKNKRNHRKVCGYLGCLVILGTLIETELPTINSATNARSVEIHDNLPNSTLHKNSGHLEDIKFNTDADSREYFINKQPVKVNTSREGWVVDLMYAQKKKIKKTKPD